MRNRQSYFSDFRGMPWRPKLCAMDTADAVEGSSEPRRGGQVAPPAAPTGRPKVLAERRSRGASPLGGSTAIGHPEALCAGELEGAEPTPRGAAAGGAPMLDTKGTSDVLVPPRAALFSERRLSEKQFRSSVATELDGIAAGLPPGKTRRRIRKQANRLRECGQLVAVRTCSDCGTAAGETARLITTCQLRSCPTCARFMANEARAKGRQLMEQVPKQRGFAFYALHLTSRFDNRDPASFTIDAIAARCRAVKQGAKYLWNRVLKHAGAGFITGLEVAPGGMVHIHAIYFGRYQDVNVLRAAWLEKLPDSPQLVIEAITNPETAVPEVFKYMMKLASPRAGKSTGWWMDPVLAARVEVALSGKRRSESYGAFRGVKLDDEPPEEQPADVRCDACGNTERFGQAIMPRDVWQREHAGKQLRLSRTGVVHRNEARGRRHVDRQNDETQRRDSHEPGAAAEAHLHCCGRGGVSWREPQDGAGSDQRRAHPRDPSRTRHPHPSFGGTQAAGRLIPSAPKQARDVPPTE